MLTFPHVSGCRKLVVFLFMSLALVTPLWAADQASETLNIAISYYNNQDYDRAISELKRFLTANPNHSDKPKANYYLAESLIQKGRPDEAFNYLDEVLGKQLSAIKVEAKDNFFNVNYYKTNIQPKMSSAHDIAYGRQALFRAGEIAYKNDDLENGRRFLFAFLLEFSNDSNNAWTLPYLGDIAKQNYEVAIGQGYNAVGRVYAEEAEYYFGTTVEVYPDSSLYKESLFGLAWAKSRLGKYAEATPIFRQLALEPNSKLAENAYYEWGLMYYEQGNYAQAMTTLQTFERQFPQSVLRNDSLRVRAKSFAGQEQYQETINLLKQITAPKVEDYLLEIRCLYGMKNFEEASKNLTALDNNPISKSVKDEIQVFQAVDAMTKNDRNSAIIILETLLRPKYDTSTKKITFAYYDPPERTRGRGGSSSSSSGETSMQGKLSEEKFLKACAILCINYAMVGRNDESNATINAMVLLAKSDDDRQSNIIDKTVNYLANAANHPSGGYAAGENIPIDPSRDGGIDFGPVVIDERDLTPAGGQFNSSGRGSGGSRGSQLSSSSGRTQSSGSRYGNNTSNTNGSDKVPKTMSEFKKELQSCQSLVNKQNKQNWREADRRLLALLGNNLSDSIGAEAALLRCKVLLELGDEDEAEVMTDLILNTYHNTVQYADALWISGEYYEKNGYPDKALERFRILAKDYQNNNHADGALFHLAWDDLDSGNKSAAIRKFKKIYTTYREGDYWSHGTWGLAYLAYEDKKFDEAEQYIQEILNHPPDQAILDRVLYLKGKLAEKREDWTVAVSAYKTLAKYCPDSPLLSTANNQAVVARNKADQANNHR